MERQGAVTFKGNGLTLLGTEVKAGDMAPDFTVIDNEMNPVRFSQLKGRNLVLSGVPSLDTPVCEIQTKRFNQEAAKLNAEVVTISMDLPFAQKRFINDHAIDKARVYSDYKDHDFGQKFGIYIKELGLLARSVFVVDKNGKVVYRQIVSELTQEPDYGKAIEAVGKLQ